MSHEFLDGTSTETVIIHEVSIADIHFAPGQNCTVQIKAMANVSALYPWSQDILFYTGKHSL